MLELPSVDQGGGLRPLGFTARFALVPDSWRHRFELSLRRQSIVTAKDVLKFVVRDRVDAVAVHTYHRLGSSGVTC